jgi:hypothetical protein
VFILLDNIFLIFVDVVIVFKPRIVNSRLKTDCNSGFEAICTHLLIWNVTDILSSHALLVEIKFRDSQRNLLAFNSFESLHSSSERVVADGTQVN